MQRLARLCVRHRIWTVGLWLVCVLTLSVVADAFGGPIEDDFELAGSDSHLATQILSDAGFDARSGSQAQVVVRTDAPLDDPTVSRQVRQLTQDVQAAVPSADAVGPLTPQGARQVSPDGRTSYVAVNLPPLTSQELDKVSDALAKVREDATAPGFQVEIGGLAVEQESEGPPTEVIGNLAAVAILLLAFGSVFAMALPIAIGVFGALGGVAAVSLGANVVGMPAFAAPVATMIAIGVGIDYALLVVTRHREAMLAGATPQEAAVAALDSAGRSVLVAGTTVVIATVGLVVMDLKMITGVALGIGASVLITMLAAVTLLPALLALVGRRIDRWSLRRRGPVGGHGTLARRWSRQVQRHTVVWAVAATATLLLLAVPALDMRLGFSDAGTQPTTSTERRAYDLIGEGFGPGANGPLVVAVSEPADGGHRVARQLAARIADTTGVAEVSRPITGSSPTVALVTVVPTTGPRAEETTDLVHRLRDRVVPTVTAGTDARVAVGGSTAAAVDFADYNADRLPTFLAVILGLAFVLLTAVFRGVVVAAKAVLVNLLSIGASFGAVVAVFQWGWGVDLLNLGASGPFEAWAPMMLIAIVFGLSMDYEVFLLSRIREEYDAGRRNGDAVAAGLARTARVITAAAAIMICVFGSFVLGSSRALQLFGFGLAFAVLIDATLVRMVLVPATMELLGDRNWWLPRWLERALPQVNIEPPLAVPDERRHADPALAQQSAGRD